MLYFYKFLYKLKFANDFSILNAFISSGTFLSHFLLIFQVFYFNNLKIMSNCQFHKYDLD